MQYTFNDLVNLISELDRMKLEKERNHVIKYIMDYLNYKN